MVPKISKTMTRVSFLVAIAALGLVFVFVPGYVADQADKVSQFGTFWLVTYFLVVGIGSALFVGASGYLSWKLYKRSADKKEDRIERDISPDDLSIKQRQDQIQENVHRIERLQPELSEEVKKELEPLREALKKKEDLEQLEIVAFGSISSGKSSVLNLLAGRPVFKTDVRGGTTVRRNEIPWPGKDRIILVDTPGLGEVDGAEHVQQSALAAENADIVLLVVDGPMRESEFRLLETLHKMNKRMILCLNKSDWYSPSQKEQLLKQLNDQTREMIAKEDVITVQGSAGYRRRIRVLVDGSEEEQQVNVPAQMENLANRLMAVVQKDGKDLLMSNLLLQSRGLLDHANQRVQQQLESDAWKIVDRWALGAGGIAALPFPIIDIAAGVGINTKMVVDLASVYHQKMDMDSAGMLIGELGKNLIAILGTTAVVTAVTSVLKAVPGISIASGLVQGIVQALVTRWIGSVFIEYFQNEMAEPEGGLAGLAKKHWKKMTTIAELKKLVDSARKQWSS